MIIDDLCMRVTPARPTTTENLLIPYEPGQRTVRHHPGGHAMHRPRRRRRTGGRVGGRHCRGLVVLRLAVSLGLDGSRGLAAPPQPTGEMRWVLYVTFPPTWLDPAEVAVAGMTPFWLLYTLHDALVKPMARPTPRQAPGGRDRRPVPGAHPAPAGTTGGCGWRRTMPPGSSCRLMIRAWPTSSACLILRSPSKPSASTPSCALKPPDGPA